MNLLIWTAATVTALVAWRGHRPGRWRVDPVGGAPARQRIRRFFGGCSVPGCGGIAEGDLKVEVTVGTMDGISTRTRRFPVCERHRNATPAVVHLPSGGVMFRFPPR